MKLKPDLFDLVSVVSVVSSQVRLSVSVRWLLTNTIRMFIFSLIALQLLFKSAASKKPPNVLFIVADDLGEN